jgi:EpsI family protein
MQSTMWGTTAAVGVAGRRGRIESPVDEIGAERAERCRLDTRHPLRYDLRTAVRRHQIILSLVLITQATAFYLLPKTEAPIVSRPLTLLPTEVNRWQMTAEYPLEPEIQKVLKADDSINRMYTGPDGTVNLFIAYFLNQKQGKVPHSPQNCMPGSGWDPVRADIVKIPLPNSTETIEVNYYVLLKGLEKNVVLYWYQSNGRVIASEYKAKIYTILDSIRKRRSDTALVRVIINVPPSSNEDAAFGVVQRFVQSMFPKIKTHLPA